MKNARLYIIKYGQHSQDGSSIYRMGVLYAYTADDALTQFSTKNGVLYHVGPAPDDAKPVEHSWRNNADTDCWEEYLQATTDREWVKSIRNS